jgi:hypothetical protein
MRCMSSCCLACPELVEGMMPQTPQEANKRTLFSLAKRVVEMSSAVLWLSVSSRGNPWSNMQFSPRIARLARMLEVRTVHEPAVKELSAAFRQNWRLRRRHFGKLFAIGFPQLIVDEATGQTILRLTSPQPTPASPT